MADDQWSMDRYDVALINAVLRNDWDRIHRMADEAREHDKDVAQRTYAIWLNHRHLAYGDSSPLPIPENHHGDEIKGCP